MKSLSGKAAQKWLAAAAILVAVLAIGGGIALHMSRTAAAEKAEQASHAVTRATLSSDQDSTKPLKIGSVAKLGPDFSVAVTKVSLYKGTTRQFVVASVKAKNTGLTTSNPRTDLVVGFARVGSPTSGESTCEVDLGTLDTQKISLSVGAAKTYAVCINIPTNTIKDGQISVQSNATGVRAAWATTGAVTKKLDEPDAEVHVALPANQIPGTADYSKNLKKIKKAIKKNKKYRDQLDKVIDAYKALPDHKNKKLKKLKKQRDNIDDAIDQLEALQKQLER
jgi:hypothetical protein